VVTDDDEGIDMGTGVTDVGKTVDESTTLGVIDEEGKSVTDVDERTSVEEGTSGSNDVEVGIVSGGRVTDVEGGGVTDVEKPDTGVELGNISGVGEGGGGRRVTDELDGEGKPRVEEGIISDVDGKGEPGVEEGNISDVDGKGEPGVEEEFVSNEVGKGLAGVEEGFVVERMITDVDGKMPDVELLK